MTDQDLFSTETAGLTEVTRPQVVQLHDGGRYRLSIGPVRKDLDAGEGAGADLRMLAYNGSIPGPTLRVPQGARITVDVRNDGDVETTVHWHGLRLENRFDGVPHETQQPIPVGGGYSCQVDFPDAGFYWCPCWSAARQGDAGQHRPARRTPRGRGVAAPSLLSGERASSRAAGGCCSSSMTCSGRTRTPDTLAVLECLADG